MRHSLPYILFLLLTVATLPAMAQPAATWLERTHDFGVLMERDGKVSCRLRVVNTGNEPLLIVKAQAGCGCTAVNFDQSPIPPGDTAAVTITYNPSGRPGQFSRQVLVTTNTTTPRTALEITGNVIPTDATLNEQYPLRAGALRISQQNIPLGEIIRGKSKTEFLSAYNASTDSLVVTVTGGKSHLRPAIVPDTVPPARVTALTVHYLTGNAPLWGLNTDTLTITARPLHGPDSGNGESARVMVMAQVIEDFGSLSDEQRRDAPVMSADCGDRLDFGTLAAAGVVTRTITVTNSGNDMLLIRRLWVPEGEGVTAVANKDEVKRGKSATVTVTVDTSIIEGELLNVPLTVVTNDPAMPRAVIRLVGLIDKK